MLLTPHALIGMAIGASSSSFGTAFGASILSHYAADLVPHWDPFDSFATDTNPWRGWKALFVLGDLILGISLGMFFTLHALWLNNDPSLAMRIFACGIGGVLPDVLYIPIAYFDSKNKIIEFLKNIQVKLHNHGSIIWGNVTQWSAALLSSLVLLSLLAR